MLRNYRFMVLALCLLAAVSPAHSVEGEPANISVTNSLKDIEIQLAKILKDKLSINGTLNIRDDNSEDLFLKVQFNSTPDKGLPEISAVIDTRIVSQDSEKNATAQVISIASFANVALIPDTDLQRLEWVNKWNRRTVPLSVYVTGDRMVASNKLLLTLKEPMTEGQFVEYFSNTIRYWPALVGDLRNSGLVE